MKVSIVIPVYNGSNYMMEAIDSALSQTYDDIEIIVVNDGSNDSGKTEEIALSYSTKIRYFAKENGGVASALNLGISKMTGDYFSWLSHDDLYFPGKIEEQINFLKNSEDQKVILYSDFELINQDGDSINVIKLVPPQSFRLWITLSSSLNGCTLLVPKKAFEEHGKFNVNLRHTQDYDMWFRLSSKYQFKHVSSNLVKSRQHGDQDSVAHTGAALEEVNELRINFFRQLKHTELREYVSGNLLIAYAKIFLSYRKSGFKKASSFVFRNFLNHFFKRL